MARVGSERTLPDGAAAVATRAQPRARSRVAVLGATAAAMAVLLAALYPSLQAGFWSWDWYWIDQYVEGNTAWGGPFYDLDNHANPLPIEVQWYRVTLSVLGPHPFAHHLLLLAGLLATLGALYLLVRRFGVPHWVGVWVVVLAGVAPAALTSWTWFAASPHMWAALLGLGAAVAHVTWRQGGSRSHLLAVAAPVLSVLGLAMKNDAVIGPLLILAWEWTGRRSEVGAGQTRAPGRTAVTAAAVLPVVAFVWWQASAVDPHRDQAETGLWQIATNALGILRFAFLWRTDAELRAEFPPAPAAPAVLILAGALVGVAVLAMAVVSLRTRPGRILVASGLASMGPVAVLQPALLSRYVLPPVLLITAAAGVGVALLTGSRARSPNRHPVLVGAAVTALATWGVLAHLASGAGAVAVREEQALLTGLTRAGLSPDDKVAVRLVDSPLEPSTATYRQRDPTLPAKQRLRGLEFLQPDQTPPAGIPVATATRHATGTYTVVLTN